LCSFGRFLAGQTAGETNPVGLFGEKRLLNQRFYQLKAGNNTRLNTLLLSSI
jgi:hypothetical protein